MTLHIPDRACFVLIGYMPRGTALAIPATWNLLPGAGAEPLQCTGFSDRRGAGKPRKNGAISGAEVPVLVPFSFPRIVAVFPFLHS